MRAQWVCSRERRIALYKRSSIQSNLTTLSARTNSLSLCCYSLASEANLAAILWPLAETVCCYWTHPSILTIFLPSICTHFHPKKTNRQHYKLQITLNWRKKKKKEEEKNETLVCSCFPVFPHIGEHIFLELFRVNPHHSARDTLSTAKTTLKTTTNDNNKN